MEFLRDSTNILGDFKFKLVPKLEFERVIQRVRSGKTKEPRASEENGMWNDFRATLDERRELNNGHGAKQVRVMTNDEVSAVTQPREAAAPLFGPPRRFNAPPQKKETQTQELHCKSDSMRACQKTFAFVEEVNVADIQQPSQSARRRCSLEDDDDDDDSDEDTLSQDVEDLLKELEEVTQSCEEKEKEEPIHQTEKELICDTSDKKFDFPDDDCSEEKQQKQRKREPEPKSYLRTENVRAASPSTGANQLSGGGVRQRQREKSNVKAVPVEQERANANEESHECGGERAPSTASAHFYLMMSKVGCYQERTCHYLDCLSEIICDPPQMIDVNDLSRRKQRSAEFANRFSRIHLYQIGRTTEELRIMPDNPGEIVSRVESLFLHVMQAAQAYLKSVEMFIYNGCPEKLSALIDGVVGAYKVCFQRKLFDTKNALGMKTLYKCDEMRNFLAIKEKSPPQFMNTFAIDSKGAKKSVSLMGLKPYKSPYAPPANPHPIPKMKKPAKAKQTFNRRASPVRMRKSTSDISTLVGCEQEAPTDKEENVLPTRQFKQLMEMVQNITNEKIGEIVGSLMEQLSSEKVHDAPEPSSVSKLSGENEEIVTSTPKPQITAADADDRMRILRQQALAERLKVIHANAEDPLYNGSRVDEPWKMLSQVSDKMLEDILTLLAKEMDFGEASFVESFLQQELAY